ncbi:phage tail tape measure protein [Ancylobacter sp. SL191]|uniref:phage tail tape measure protein n=1 Tax=Ancylobacter sp. SL191 TaxID=2995166 RepID=UPI00226E4F49|nr:phage tail tape measure protein [Ancylobacter sp. SL191]WAC26433.1 phage tail tape measure protein [Ancylobacter sp. SL191]
MGVVKAILRIIAEDRTARAFAAIEQRIHRQERLLHQLNRKERQMAALNRGGGGLIMGGGAILGGLAAASGTREGLTTLTSYQDALIEIAKKGGLTADQMQKVGEEAKALATSGEVAVPLEEILAAYERAAAAGLPMEEWREFAKLGAKAADAFGMAAEEVGNAAAGFKVGLGIPMAEMERYFDLINSLADSGIAEERDLITFLDNAGAGLKNFGLNAKEAAAYGATLLNLKMAPETSARMMSALTSKLIAPENLGKKGYGALQEVVGNVKQFKKELSSDPQGALRKFLEKLSKMDKFRRARITGSIFGMEWTDEVMRLVDGLEELDRNLQIAASTDWFGSLDKSYQMKLDALSSRWQLFKNQVSKLAIDLGTLSMPALESSLTAARDTVREISEEFAKFPEMIDVKAIDDASEALKGMASDVMDLLGIDPNQSLIASGFRDLANLVNEIAKVINDIKTSLPTSTDPEAGVLGGIVSLEKGGTADKIANYLGGDGAPKEAGRSFFGGLITFDKGGVADRIADGIDEIDRWLSSFNGENAAAASNGPQPPQSGASGGAVSSPNGNGAPLVEIPDVPPLIVDPTSIQGSADAIRDAIAEGGRQAAQAISSARINVPNFTPRPAINANTGQSMPNAGLPGAN